MDRGEGEENAVASAQTPPQHKKCPTSPIEEQDSKKSAEYPFESADSEAQFPWHCIERSKHAVIEAIRTSELYSVQVANSSDWVR